MTFKYNLSQADIATVKRAAKFMRLGWQSIAARSSQAMELIQCIDETETLEEGCLRWAHSNWNKLHLLQ